MHAERRDDGTIVVKGSSVSGWVQTALVIGAVAIAWARTEMRSNYNETRIDRVEAAAEKRVDKDEATNEKLVDAIGELRADLGKIDVLAHKLDDVTIRQQRTEDKIDRMWARSPSHSQENRN